MSFGAPHRRNGEIERVRGASMNLNSILIGSEEPRRLVDYYTKLFGEPGWNMEGYVGWQVGSGGFTVGPHDQVHGTNDEPGTWPDNCSRPGALADRSASRPTNATSCCA
jgi:hypothetical protein